MLKSNRTSIVKIDEVGDLDHIPVSELRALYNYWCAKKGDRVMPSRSDIRPAEIVDLLPKVGLIDVEHAPRRYRLRLLGTEVVLALGQEMTGKYLDEISPSGSGMARLNKLVEHKAGYYVTSQLDWMNRGFQKYQAVFLPLGDEKGVVNMILCGMRPYFQKGYVQGQGVAVGPNRL
ncbi:PAS domain-containing protein [Paremcibacter congregatus]|uniref:PAS domain-containing protein n=1 Tax=Paremcibacter congregatus TaxID=2043170 RepID=A0A2G4YRY9_9PROT|nr:PAS domain-containing protein [Paremcibacter congregatus]PHZ85037.1 PAS domain-containing protein [Paremcibacter congregatus]QDE25988.1 PAS domain-containing protein [Paremcibacter congregatus]